MRPGLQPARGLGRLGQAVDGFAEVQRFLFPDFLSFPWTCPSFAAEKVKEHDMSMIYFFNLLIYIY
jgi:hypothetical protein